MTDFVDVDLEACMKELAAQIRRDLERMTPFERHDYFLCRGIEHLTWVQACDASTAMDDIAGERQESSRCAAEPAREAASGKVACERSNVLAFRVRGRKSLL